MGLYSFLHGGPVAFFVGSNLRCFDSLFLKSPEQEVPWFYSVTHAIVTEPSLLLHCSSSTYSVSFIYSLGPFC